MLNTLVDTCFVDKILLNLIDACLIVFNFVKRIEDNNLKKTKKNFVVKEIDSQSIFFIILHHSF